MGLFENWICVEMSALAPPPGNDANSCTCTLKLNCARLRWKEVWTNGNVSNLVFFFKIVFFKTGFFKIGCFQNWIFQNWFFQNCTFQKLDFFKLDFLELDFSNLDFQTWIF